MDSRKVRLALSGPSTSPSLEMTQPSGHVAWGRFEAAPGPENLLLKGHGKCVPIPCGQSASARKFNVKLAAANTERNPGPQIDTSWRFSDTGATRLECCTQAHSSRSAQSTESIDAAQAGLSWRPRAGRVLLSSLVRTTSSKVPNLAISTT